MKLIYGLSLITALVAMPAIAEAQQQQRPTQTAPDNRSGMQQRQARTPSAVIMQHKDDLKLSAEQVAQVEKIGKELEEKNRPLQEKMREARGSGNMNQMSAEERAELRQKMAPITEEIRKNTEASREKLLQVLDAEQQKKFKEIWEASQQRNQQRGRRPGGTRGT